MNTARLISGCFIVGMVLGPLLAVKVTVPGWLSLKRDAIKSLEELERINNENRPSPAVHQNPCPCYSCSPLSVPGRPVKGTARRAVQGPVTCGPVDEACNPSMATNIYIEEYETMNGLPVDEQVDTIVAYKYVSIVMRQGNWSLKGVSGGGFYNVEDHFVCPGNKPREKYREVCVEAPGVQCKCGFYGWKDKASLEPMYGFSPFVADIEMFGTILECEDGYRATDQRILGIKTRSRCYYCANNGEVMPLIKFERYLLLGAAICDDHSTTMQNQVTTIPIHHISSLLGTEVSFL